MERRVWQARYERFFVAWIVLAAVGVAAIGYAVRSLP